MVRCESPALLPRLLPRLAIGSRWQPRSESAYRVGVDTRIMQASLRAAVETRRQDGAQSPSSIVLLLGHIINKYGQKQCSHDRFAMFVGPVWMARYHAAVHAANIGLGAAGSNRSSRSALLVIRRLF